MHVWGVGTLAGAEDNAQVGVLCGVGAWNDAAPRDHWAEARQGRAGVQGAGSCSESGLQLLWVRVWESGLPPGTATVLGQPRGERAGEGACPGPTGLVCTERVHVCVRGEGAHVKHVCGALSPSGGPS